jgi:hypothetical protein
MEKEDGDVAAVEGAKGKGKPTKELGGTAVALANAIRWVQDVLDLKDKFDGVLRDAFAGDKGIQTAINEVRFSHPSVSCLCPFSSWCVRDVASVCSAADLVLLLVVDRARAGLWDIRELEPEIGRVHLALHRRQPQEGSQGGSFRLLPFAPIVRGFSPTFSS